MNVSVSLACNDDNVVCRQSLKSCFLTLSLLRSFTTSRNSVVHASSFTRRRLRVVPVAAFMNIHFWVPALSATLLRLPLQCSLWETLNNITLYPILRYDNLHFMCRQKLTCCQLSPPIQAGQAIIAILDQCLAFGSMTCRVQSIIHGRRCSSGSHSACPFTAQCILCITVPWTTMPKRTEHSLIVRICKSEANVTNNKRQR